MNATRFVFICSVLLTANCCAVEKDDSSTTQESVFTKQIRTFQQWDRCNTFPEKAILFIGDARVRNWNTRECFPQNAVINRGMDKAAIGDLTTLADRLIIPYKPAQIVLFASSGLPMEKVTAANVLNDCKTFAKTIHELLPDTHIVFLSALPLAEKKSPTLNVQQANKFIESLCNYNQKLSFVNITRQMQDSGGRIKSVYIDKGNSKLNTQAYKTLAASLKPALKMTTNIKTDALPAGEESRVDVQEKQPSALAGFAASKSSKIFHKYTCSFVKRMSAENIVQFNNRDQAIQTGRRPCKTCSP